MCNCILETLYSLHHNRCTNAARKRSILSSPIASLSASLVLIRSTPEPKTRNYICNYVRLEKNTQILTNVAKKTENVAKIEDADEEYSDFDTDIECQCGKILKKGWQCGTCRKNCSICYRALSVDPEEYCTRCYTYCHEHGLLKKSSLQTYTECTKCVVHDNVSSSLDR